MGKRVALGIVIFGFIFGTVKLTAAPTLRPVIGVMQFKPARPEQWKHDDDAVLENVDADHFVFNENDKIDLNVVRQEDTLWIEFEAKGQAEIVRGILEGQNFANKMFNVGETNLLDQKLESKERFKILTLHSKQELPDGTVERIEKFYIANGQTLHVELRWYQSENSKLVAQARDSFENSELVVKENAP